ncbi:MAG: gas vesicle protein [Candidatus Schekmanbacteria bacterium]|nr:gas vesicle protein [Candidatus Schekmanbacteria bacterium]
MSTQRNIQHSNESTTLADLLERILDKGVVIAGDIKISLVEVELLTIQIRLVVCSVDKAKEIGIDFWSNNPAFNPRVAKELPADSVAGIQERLERLENSLPVSGSPSQAVISVT